MLVLHEVLPKAEVREVREALDRAPFEARRKERLSEGKTEGLLKNNLELAPGHPEARPAADLIRVRLLSHFEFGSYAMPRDMRFFFNKGTRRRAPSSGFCREIATIRSAVLGGIFEIDFFDVCFEAIFQ